MTHKYLTFYSDKNKLEGILYEPKENSKTVSIVLHPHPEFGGSMDNNVVNGVCEVLNKNGLGAFKFNCSGIGRSTGYYGGFSQAHKDIISAVEFLKSDFENIGFIGYSWGSYTGLKALYLDNSIKFLCGISPPLSFWNFDFITDKASKQPKVFVIGEYDEFCNKEDFINLFEKIPVKQKSYKILPTNHFYLGFETLAGEFILDFILKYI
ncbi:MAG: alpha/beta hydrolase [Candidatus Helarchaeota archaeon]